MAETNSERTPLLAGQGGEQQPYDGQRTQNQAQNDDEREDLADLNQQVRAMKRRRWISFGFSLLLIVAFIVLLILSGVLSRSNKLHMGSSLCLSSACIHAASEVLYNLDPDYQNIDACTDFDKLVCRGFDQRHEIPQAKSGLSTISVMADSGALILRHVLESPYPKDSSHSYFSPQSLVTSSSNADELNFDMLKTAYDSCMNTTKIDKIGVAPLNSLVEDLAKIFPAGSESVDSLGSESKALSNAILFLETIGVSSFESLGPSPDDKNPDVVIVQAGPAGLTLPSPDYYKDEKLVQDFQSMLEKVFGALLPTKAARAVAAKNAKAVVDFEKKIAAITPPPEDQQDITKSYNIVEVAEAGKIGPALRLDLVIKQLVPSEYTAEKMMLSFPDFLGNISSLVSSSTKDTVQSYLVWKLIESYADFVSGPEVTPIEEFGNMLAGKDPSTKSERWETCLSYVNRNVGWILSRFFIEAAFSANAKDLGDRIIKDIKQQFIIKLKSLDWMDSEVKKLAIDKVNNIDQKIGYPTESPNIMDPESLREYYDGLTITDSFFNNTISSTKLSNSREWSSLGKPVDHGKWYMTANTINAYYSPVGNEIVFPAGIMQFPVFSEDLPSYVSYGAFGSVSGHELSHAFDNSGRHYDQRGNFTDWWSEYTVEQFQKRADCFVKQYSNFSVEGTDGSPLHVNGQLTLGENIADSGGVAAAFASWKSRQAEQQDEDLPGLDYFSHEQLFHIFYAQFWCGKIRKEQAIQRIYTDPHSPAFARILGTMANSRSFRESFNCPVKEPTCELW